MNWISIINKAEKRGSFYDCEIDCAKSWHHCACWTLPQRMRRGFFGEPSDCELQELGVDFLNNITLTQFEQAKKTMKKISNRIKKIKKEE